MLRFVGMLSLAALIAASGCDNKSTNSTPDKVTADDVRRDAGQAVHTAVEYSEQTKVEFQKQLATRIDELDAEIVKLREKGRDLQDQAKASWELKMAELEKKREVARAKLAEVGNSTAEAWKDIQKGAQAAWDDLEKSFHEASKEF